MDRLTKEQIAAFWAKAMNASAQEFVGFLRQGALPDYAHSATLPERFALLIQDHLQSLSLESVRSEALEEAAKVCEKIVAKHDSYATGADDHFERITASNYANAAIECYHAIRALQSPARVAEDERSDHDVVGEHLHSTELRK